VGQGGRWPPRLSIAIAMRASGDLKPKAMRVMSRILVLVVIWSRRAVLVR